MSLPPGKEQPLEVLESEPELKEEVLDEESAEEKEPQETSLSPEGSALELSQPKMKIFPGDSAPGLRIRNAPSFMVRFFSS